MSMDDTMVPLEAEDVGLMERFSFRRKPPVLELEWMALTRRTSWQDIFGSIRQSDDHSYHHWKIGFLKPEFPVRKSLLVYIATNDSFSYRKPWEYNIGLLGNRDVGVLVADLTSR